MLLFLPLFHIPSCYADEIRIVLLSGNAGQSNEGLPYTNCASIHTSSLGSHTSLCIYIQSLQQWKVRPSGYLSPAMGAAAVVCAPLCTLPAGYTGSSTIRRRGSTALAQGKHLSREISPTLINSGLGCFHIYSCVSQLEKNHLASNFGIYGPGPRPRKFSIFLTQVRMESKAGQV